MLYGCHQTKADVDRIYKKIENDGRDMTNIMNLFMRMSIRYARFMEEKKDNITEIWKCDRRKNKYDIHAETSK